MKCYVDNCFNDEIIGGECAQHSKVENRYLHRLIKKKRVKHDHSYLRRKYNRKKVKINRAVTSEMELQNKENMKGVKPFPIDPGEYVRFTVDKNDI